MAKHTDNIFLKGNSSEQECAQKWYDLLMTRQPVTRKMALAACCDYPLDHFANQPITSQHLKPTEYNKLKKLDNVLATVVSAINERVHMASHLPLILQTTPMKTVQRADGKTAS